MNVTHNKTLFFTLLLTLLTLAGCGKKDGVKELAAGWSAYDVRDLKKADQLFAKSLEYNANNVDALMAAARIKMELAEIPGAKELLARAEALAPTDDDVLLLAAQLAYHDRDYKSATSRFAAFAADTTREAKVRAEAYVGLAVVEITCNNRDAARVALLKALILDRYSAPAHYHLGKVYRDLNFDEAALEQFEVFVRLDAVADVRVQRVQRQVIPAIKDAIAHKATERRGVENRNSSQSATWLKNADAEWKKGNFKKARAFYADALKADPLSYPAALGVAKAWEKCDTTPRGKREALSCYQTACSLKPGASKTLLTTARLAASLGNNAVAIEAYSRALAVDTKSIDAVDGLIRELRKTGNKGAKTAALWQSYRDMISKK